MLEQSHFRPNRTFRRVPERCPDLIAGMAGSALGRLALADELGDPRLVERARATGEILISRATVTSHGWSWAGQGRRYPAQLCGISHGAAGIGWALLELFAATGDDRFRAGATGAFAYERSWLDQSAGRWPDLRIRGQRRGPLAPIDSGIYGHVVPRRGRHRVDAVACGYGARARPSPR